MKSLTYSALCLALSVVGYTSVADEIAEQGRALLDKHKDSVVTVQLVLTEKMSFPGMPSQDQESTSEVTGTIISEEGLAILSLFTTDPTVLVEAMMAGNPQMSQIEMSTEIEEARYLMPDGDEIPAEVVLRDKELDMVFIRPIEKAETPFTYLDLSQGATPELLEHMVTLRRLNRVAGRTYAASVTRLEAIVERPRTFYIGEGAQDDMTRLGAPTFTLDGGFIGVTFVRFMPNDGGFGGMGAMMSAAQNIFTTVILPAEDILDSASQVPSYAE